MFQGKIDATIGDPTKFFNLPNWADKNFRFREPKDFGVPAPGSEINSTRQAIKELRTRLTAFFMAYSERLRQGEKIEN